MEDQYTVYQITNRINNRKYIGKHITNDINDGYFGSGRYLEIAFDDYGIENFEKDIICLCRNPKEMGDIEKYLIYENTQRGNKLYNLIGSGKRFKNKQGTNEVEQEVTIEEWEEYIAFLKNDDSIESKKKLEKIYEIIRN